MTGNRQPFSLDTDIRSLEIQRDRLRQAITYADRPGSEPALLCLHGLGSTKDDYAPLTHHTGLAGRRIVAWDAPGSGASPYLQSLTVEQLAALVLELCEHLNLQRPVLVGHSLGGLTGLLAARQRPGMFSGFINIEGNLTPEDCGVFSRTADALTFEQFASEFFDRIEREFGQSKAAGYSEFARRFRDNVSEETFWDYCRSIVKISDSEPLLADYCALPMPCLYVHGSENHNLPAAEFLRAAGAGIAEIPSSNHFPLYSNPEQTLAEIARFCAGLPSTQHQTRSADRCESH